MAFPVTKGRKAWARELFYTSGLLFSCSRYHPLRGKVFFDTLRHGGTTGYIAAKKIFLLWRFLSPRDAKRGHESCFTFLVYPGQVYVRLNILHIPIMFLINL